VFSVVIPCHERADEVSRVLEGFCAQQGDFEVVLVDNNSVRESLERVHRTYRSRLELTLVQQPELPHPFALSRARNTAMRLAAGEWIVSVDSDCIPGPGYLSAVAAAARGQVILTGERIFVEPPPLADIPSVLPALPRILSHANYGLPRDRRFPRLLNLPDVLHPWDLMHGGNTVFPRSAALEAGGFDEDFDGHWGYEDVEFAHRMITAGCVPLFVPGMEVYHQEPPPTEAQPDRYDKAANPNWAYIGTRIEGYLDFKMAANVAAGVRYR